MAEKIHLGLIGASVSGTWSSRSHLPAVQDSQDVELTAVCTTKTQTAEAARNAWNAKLAFNDYETMVASPEIDTVAVVVRVPSHYGPVKAALEAGKHVYCEWPLGQTTAEAEELAALAKAKGLKTAIGLQSRVNPGMLYVKELLEGGYVGEIMAVQVSLVREGVLQRPSHRTWQHDASLGANTLTIANGHTLDAMRFTVGEIGRFNAVVSTQAKQWLDTGTKEMVDVTSPDHVLTAGQLVNGAAFSIHVGVVPFAGNGYHMAVYGREGTLTVSGPDSPQLNEVVIMGAQGNDTLAPLTVPDRFAIASAGRPNGEAFNVGQMYARLNRAIRGGDDSHPTFETAVRMHHVIDAIRKAAESERAVTFG